MIIDYLLLCILSPEYLREPSMQWKLILSTFLPIDQIIVVIAPKVLFRKLKGPFVPFVRDEVLQTYRRTHPNRNGFITDMSMSSNNFCFKISQMTKM